MALVNRAIPALYNGVSQQPATLRLPSQAQSQINGWSNVVNGLQHRPPFQTVGKISNTSLSSAYLSIVNRDLQHQYVIVITNGNLQVFDLEGNTKTVTFPNGKAYLNSGSALPNAVFSVTTVADYSFVLNKTITVAMSAVAADQSAQPASYISLSRQMTAAQAAALASNAYGKAQSVQYPPNPAASAISGTVQTFDELPGGPSAAAGTPAPVDGDVWTVQGDDSSDFTAYYCIYQGGVWDETVKPGLQNALDATTMPWALVHNADDTFTFSPFSWAPRSVGDETSNPNPSFVGRTINDIFFYQNRLGLLAGENCILSRSADFGNYYRLTVLQELDDDQIDIGASETNVTNLYFAVPFATGLMLFSDQTQFRLVTPIDTAFTPTTVSLQVATRYISSTVARPQMLGPDIYFVQEDASFAHLREYFVQLSFTGQIQTDAEDVTSHCPSYIPQGVYCLAGSNQHDAIFMATSANPQFLYVYKFYWADAQNKAQSSVSYWDMGSGCQVLAAAGLNDYLYALVARPDGTYIEQVNLAVGANVGLTDSNGNLFDLMLDQRCNPVAQYSAAPANYTTFTFPYQVNQANVALVLGAGSSQPGLMLNPSTYTFPTTTSVRVPGNVSAGTVWGGNAYTFSYQFSEQFMLNQNNVAILSGRLTLRNWRIYYVNTAYFNISVDSYGNGNPIEMSYTPADGSTFTGMTGGATNLYTGTPVFYTGKAEFGVYGQSNEATITLSNNTPFPVTFFEAEWEGEYDNRGRTI